MFPAVLFAYINMVRLPVYVYVTIEVRVLFFLIVTVVVQQLLLIQFLLHLKALTVLAMNGIAVKMHLSGNT